MAFVNHMPKVANNDDCEGRKGRVEIYVCGVLTERGVRNVVMKRQMSLILSVRAELVSYSNLE